MTGNEFSWKNCSINQKPAQQQSKEASATYKDPMTSRRDRMMSARHIKMLGRVCCVPINVVVIL